MVRRSVPIALLVSHMEAQENATRSVKQGAVSMHNVADSCEDERGPISSLFVFESVVIIQYVADFLLLNQGSSEMSLAYQLITAVYGGQISSTVICIVCLCRRF